MVKDSRTLVIKCFTSHARAPGDAYGLELLLGQWLVIKRPVVSFKFGEYTINCDNVLAAKKVVEWFGGERRGESVVGAVVDLTT